MAAEYAFVSVRHTRLDELVGQGDKRAREVRKIVSDPSHFISAMQFGITLSSLALGALGEPAVSKLIEHAIGRVSTSVSTTFSVILAFVVISVLHRDRRDHPQVVHAAARRASGPRGVTADPGVLRDLRPFSSVPRLVGAVDHAPGRHPDDGRIENAHSEEELRLLVHRSRGVGLLEADEEEMIGKVFDFAEPRCARSWFALSRRGAPADRARAAHAMEQVLLRAIITLNDDQWYQRLLIFKWPGGGGGVAWWQRGSIT